MQLLCSFSHSSDTSRLRMDLTSGVVLDIGHGIVTCAAVWRGEECPHPLSCNPDDATPTKLADMVHSIVSGCGRGKNVEMQKVLKESIVITGIYLSWYFFQTYHDHLHAPCFIGGKAENVDKIQEELLRKDPTYMVHEPGKSISNCMSERRISEGVMLVFNL